MKGILGRISGFFNDIKLEMKKVSYPTRTETVGSTSVVLVLVLIVGIYLSGIDLGLAQAIRKIFQ